MKTPLTGTPIWQDAQMIVMQEGIAVARYSRDKYYLTVEPEQPVQLTYGLHAIAVPYK